MSLGRKDFRLVTDGRKLYRIPRSEEIPERAIEVTSYKGDSVYDSHGKLLKKFMVFPIIQPHYRYSKMAIAVRQAIAGAQNGR